MIRKLFLKVLLLLSDIVQLKTTPFSHAVVHDDVGVGLADGVVELNTVV